MISKRFVLDTNVLLHDPFAINRFGQHEVILPIYVVEELDQFKKSVNGLGRNARAVARQLDAFRKTGRLNEGVDLENGGRLRVMLLSKDVPDTAHFVVQHMYDNLILKCALVLREEDPDKPVIVVTKDTNLRIRADAVGLESEDYEPAPVDVSLLYQGHREVVVSSDQIREAFRDGLSLDVDDIAANEYVVLVDEESETHTLLVAIERRLGLSQLSQEWTKVYGAFDPRIENKCVPSIFCWMTASKWSRWWVRRYWKDITCVGCRSQADDGRSAISASTRLSPYFSSRARHWISARNS